MTDKPNTPDRWAHTALTKEELEHQGYLTEWKREAERRAEAAAHERPSLVLWKTLALILFLFLLRAVGCGL